MSCAEQAENDRFIEQFEKQCLEHIQFDVALCADLGQPWRYEASVVTVCWRCPGQCATVARLLSPCPCMLSRAGRFDVYSFSLFRFLIAKIPIEGNCCTTTVCSYEC